MTVDELNEALVLLSLRGQGGVEVRLTDGDYLNRLVAVATVEEMDHTTGRLTGRECVCLATFDLSKSKTVSSGREA